MGRTATGCRILTGSGGGKAACSKTEARITILNLMAREVTIGDRRFYIISEPEGEGWRAQVLERLGDQGATRDMEIEASGETRSLADERALGVLQQHLRKQS